MTISRSLDGQVFDHYKVRFSGAVEIDDVDAARIGLGEDLEMTVLINVKDIAVKTLKGEITRVAVLNVFDAKLPTNHLFDPIGYEHQVTTGAEPPASAEEWRQFIRRDDLETVTNVPAGPVPERTFAETDNDGNFIDTLNEGITVVGRIGNAAPRASNASGPKVLPFSPDDEPTVVDRTLPLASVGSRDRALSRFIDESVG